MDEDGFDWCNYDQDEGGEEDLQMDFDPIARTKDPIADSYAVEGDSDGGADLYDDEEQLFCLKINSI